jgi:metallo-beta-lactamase class B
VHSPVHVALILAVLTGGLFSRLSAQLPAPTSAPPPAARPPVARALASETPSDRPFPPHRVAGNLYFVGTAGLGVYLVTTPDGHALINGVYPQSVPLVRASIEQLGFNMRDIKVMLNSHAHPDHVSGNADLKALTGADVLVMDDDVEVIRTGGRSDFQYSNQELYPPGPVDRVLQDRDHVTLGGMDLLAMKTPGHTRGCTTWTFKVTDGSRTLDVVILCSINFNPGYRLVDNTAWPGIAGGFAHTYRAVSALPADIWLAPHTFMFGLTQKFEKSQQPGAANAYIDPDGYRAYVTARRSDFLEEFRRQMTP